MGQMQKYSPTGMLSNIMIYFNADYHFNHHNALGFDIRPFFTMQEMTFEIIKRHNELVKPTDTFYFLGDFMFDRWQNFDSYFDQLNGHKHIIWGNHDHKQFRKKVASKWESVQHYLEINYNGRLFVLCHYPFASWKNSVHGSINVHGHSHGSPHSDKRRNNQIDVGCMNNNYYPFSIDQVIELCLERRLKSFETHALDEGE